MSNRSSGFSSRATCFSIKPKHWRLRLRLRLPKRANPGSTSRRTSARSAAASHSIRHCRGTSCATRCPKPNASVPMVAPRWWIGAEISELIDVIPQQVRVIQHHRIKYACPCCDQGIQVAPAPARIIPKGLFAESALAWIVCAKYMDGLPLYRIATLCKPFWFDISGIRSAR
jgi:hypothetical protein